MAELLPQLGQDLQLSVFNLHLCTTTTQQLRSQEIIVGVKICTDVQI